MSTKSEEEIRKLVEKSSKELLDGVDGSKQRGHLGASQIGHRCARQAWYGFRWFYRGQHTGRMLRLFNRGHDEETRMIRWLRSAGYEVLETDPATGKQWSFNGFAGHFSGSCDGVIRGPHLPEGWGIVEFKTMNDKSFKEVTAKGVLTSKPVYWVQSQIYMRMLNLTWCLFISVNKNDDEIYYEIIRLKPEVADQYLDLARRIIESQTPPSRLTEDPSWFECKFCDFREICHYEKVPQKNCRSCQYSVATADGNFYCNLAHANIPLDFQQIGCDQWLPH